MNLSLNWLKEYVDLPKSYTPEKIGDALTMHTVEVEETIEQAKKFDRVVVGKILEISKHPNADRLQIAKVDIKSEELNIVCGAPNIEVGQLAPVAMVGAVLAGGFEIKEASVRGVESRGMLCAEDELGLGEDHSGIMILEKGAKLGQNFSDYLGLDDIVFEVDNKSLSNRPDLWGHIGIARELSAIFNISFKNLDLKSSKLETDNSQKLSIKIEDYDLCPRYMGAVIEGIKIEPSPKWLQDRLIAVGVRPINNIVDITNYVMLETGQPMHAFDTEKISEDGKDAKIIVRKAEKEEVVKTLDGEERKLNEETLVIADNKKAIAVAGVMGGGNSEVHDDTTSIVLESANFDYVSIRKTSTKLGLRTEASMRYEKGLDPNLCEVGFARAAELIKKVCPEARIVSEIKDENKYTLNTGPVTINYEWAKGIIGEEIAEKEMVKILESLGFGVESGEEEMKITIPTWRATRDIALKEDIVEEIIRIYGFNKIPSKMPEAPLGVPFSDKSRVIIRKIKNILSTSCALTETYNYSFIGEEYLEKLGMDYSSYVRLVNPIANNLNLLRQNLAPGLIANIKTNQARYDDITLFEIGNVYHNIDGEIVKGDDSSQKLPYQEKRLGIIIAGKGKNDTFELAKGVWENLLTSFNLESTYSLTDVLPPWADKNISAQISISGIDVGFIGALSSGAAKKTGTKKQATIIEVSLPELIRVIQEKSSIMHEQEDKYPPLIRDLAFVVNERVLYNDIKNEINEFNEYIKNVELFDIYRGENIGKENKSLAFRVFYQADRTLTSKEVDVWQKELIKKLEEKFEAKIRDF